MRLFLLKILCILLFGFPMNGWAAVWHVKPDGSDDNAGRTWQEALGSIQRAVDLAGMGDEIWVAAGTYPLTRTITVVKPVHIYGGFSGTEKRRTERDWVHRVSTVDGKNQTRCFSIIADAVLDGLTIVRGYACRGGGVFMRHVDKTLEYYDEKWPRYIPCYPRIANCTFYNNHAGDCSTSRGGALFNLHASPTITHCVFVNNSSNPGSGGAVAHEGAFKNDHLTFKMIRCTLSNNFASANGGALLLTGPYAGLIQDSTFLNNFTDNMDGGAVFASGDGTLDLVNGIFSGNAARWWRPNTRGDGGALYVSGSVTHITHCTFYGNGARRGGGIYAVEAAPSIYNCIFWDNTADQIFCGSPSNLRIRHCNIQDWPLGKTIIRQRPLFVNASRGDFHLKAGSPCIDTGTPDAPVFPDRDFEGNPRIFGSAPDMGADEYIPLNRPPVPNAGSSLSITSEEQKMTVMQGSARDPDGNPMRYRWIEGRNELSPWRDVGAYGKADLDLSKIPYLPLGEHELRLEVSDGLVTASGRVSLTLLNAPPRPAPTAKGEFVYEMGAPVVLEAKVADFDGDTLIYEWIKEDEVLFTGGVQTLQGGYPVDLPEHYIYDLGLGSHLCSLRVADGINEAVEKDLVMLVHDTTPPSLVPVISTDVLWPPNRAMVAIEIDTHAMDNSGGDVTLYAEVSSNEAVEGPEEEDLSPDWTKPVIEQKSAIIYLELRAERSSTGEGRIYTVLIRAGDESDNQAEVAIDIRVPLEKPEEASSY